MQPVIQERGGEFNKNTHTHTQKYDSNCNWVALLRRAGEFSGDVRCPQHKNRLPQPREERVSRGHERCSSGDSVNIWRARLGFFFLHRRTQEIPL